jgi:hypothetical protein
MVVFCSAYHQDQEIHGVAGLCSPHVWKKALGLNPANGSCVSTPINLQLDSQLVRVKSPAPRPGRQGRVLGTYLKQVRS